MHEEPDNGGMAMGTRQQRQEGFWWESQRGMAWRAASALGPRRFLRIGRGEAPPDHSTISRTRRLIDVETHREVFTWVLGVLARKGLLQGKTLGVDATTLEANAALRSIVRRDS